jgi:ribosomal protein L40E
VATLADPLVDTLIIVLAVVAVFAVIAYLEIRFLRARREARIDARMMKDDTFNAIITTKAVARSLKDRGYVTKEADLLLIEAESAFERGNFLETKEKAGQARAALRDLQRPEETIKPLVDITAEPEPVEETPTSIPAESPLAEAKKLPKNYLESKFMLSTAADAVAAAEQAGADVARAKESLAIAQIDFDTQMYTEALSHALKAKKAAEEVPESPAPERPVMTERLVLPPNSVTPIDPSASVQACEQCGAAIKDIDDNFCRKCGATIPRKTACHRCGAETAPDDVFCRKCGARLAR